MDNEILGVDEAAWAKSIELFKQYALSLDALTRQQDNRTAIDAQLTRDIAQFAERIQELT